MRKALAIGAGGTLAISAIAWSVWALSPCRPLDRLLGRSGCVGSLVIADLSSLRETLVFDPKRPDVLVAAGLSRRRGHYRNEIDATANLVVVAFPGGGELRRQKLEPDGLVQRLVLSPDGAKATTSCNIVTKCDFAPDRLPSRDAKPQDFLPVSLSALDAAQSDPGGLAPRGARWMRFAPAAVAQPDADGRSADIGFSADGQAVVASGFGWTLAGEPVDPPPAPAYDPRGRDRVVTSDGAQRVSYDGRASALLVADAAGGAERRRMALDLPQGFVAALHPALALSPDGTRVAALIRRFSGPGALRAVLQVWRISDGARLVRHEIETDLYATLVFTPDGSRALVAVAPKPEPFAATEIRIYPAGDGA